MLISLLCLCAFARAEISTINSTVRALGMGDAFTAVSRDGSALFYNPAGLSRTEGVRWDVLNVRAGASGIDAYNDVKHLKSNSSNSEYAAGLNKLYGKSIWTGLAADSTFTIPGVAFAAFDHADARVAVDNPVNPSIYTGIVNDFGYVLGWGAPLSDQLHFGVAGRYVKRTGARVPFGAAFLADLKPDVIQSHVTGWGTGYGVDFGLEYVIPLDRGEVIASGTWRNVGQTRYFSESAATVVPFDDNDVTVGLAANFVSPGLRITPAADVRYLNSSSLQLGRRINFGVEVGLPFVDLRAGFREGYYTLGAGFDFGMFRVAAASYGVELGTYPGQVEDRRYVAEFSVALDLGDAFRARYGRLKRRR